MKARTALIIGLATIMTPLVLKGLSGSQAPKGGKQVFGIEDNRARIVRACVERLRRIPEARSALTEDELVAIGVLRSYRSDALPELQSLLRVVHMRRKKSKFPKSNWPTFASRAPRPKLLSEYPAARALISIGLPSVHAIVGELDTSEKPPSKERVKIYSGVLLEILGAKHARPFLEIERKDIPAKKQNYDAVLRFIDKTCAEWRSRELERQAEIRKAALRLKADTQPATKPARR